MMRILRKLNEIAKRVFYFEPVVFFVILILNIIPLLDYSYFPSLDGPAHGYNTQIIKSLLFDENSFYKDFIQINGELVPNWSGHVLLGILSSVFSMATSEKIVQLLLVICLPIAFRKLLKTISPESILMSYFIFPFTYSVVFLFGFYNFSISLILLFYTLNYVIVNYGNISKFKQSLILFLLIFLTYFSHALIFLFLVMLIGIYVLFQLINKALTDQLKLKEIARLFWKKLLWGLLVFGAPMLLFFTSQLKKNSNDLYGFLPVDELLTWIVESRPFVVYNYTNDVVFTYKITWVFAILIGLVLATYLYKLKTKKIKFKIDFWLVAFVIFLALVFILPDTTGAGGIISIRILLLMLMFLILMLSRIQLPKLLVIPLIIFYLITNDNLLEQRESDWREMDQSAYAMRKVGEKIRENSVVLPFNFSYNWMKGHFSNYIGFDKTVMLLDNYEVTQSYFPTTLKKSTLPSFQIGDQPVENSCIGWISGKNGVQKVDYVLIEGNFEDETDSCRVYMVETILKYYKPIYKLRGITLFKAKPISKSEKSS